MPQKKTESSQANTLGYDPKCLAHSDFLLAGYYIIKDLIGAFKNLTKVISFQKTLRHFLMNQSGSL